jgi:hypothetical protein
MQRLPAVLQNEIWTYVRGDRAFWKTQYDQVVIHLLGAIDLAEEEIFLIDFSTPKSSAILSNHARHHWYINDNRLEYMAFRRRLALFPDTDRDHHEFMSAMRSHPTPLSRL